MFCVFIGYKYKNNLIEPNWISKTTSHFVIKFFSIKNNLFLFDKNL